MPSYSFACKNKRCENEFSLVSNDEIDVSDIACVSCDSLSVELISFDAEVRDTAGEFAQRIFAIHKRVELIEDILAAEIEATEKINPIQLE